MSRRPDAPTLVTLTDHRAAVTEIAAAVYEDQWLTVKQAATEANVCVHTIRRAYQGGHLRVRRFGVGGSRILIRRGDLREWEANGGRTDLAPGRIR